MTTLLQQRAFVANAIEADTYIRRLNPDQPTWEFTSAAVPYRPLEIITDEELKYTRNPHITVMGLVFDEEPTPSRSTKRRTAIIRVFIEALVEPRYPQQVDDLIDLTDQVLETCSNLHRWLRMEPIRDEHGMPFMFHVAREKSVFQAIMQPMYEATASRKRR